MITYSSVILISWALFILVWGIGALRVKRDISGGSIVSLWYRYWFLRVGVAALVVYAVSRIVMSITRSGSADVLLFHKTLFTPPLYLGWFAALLSVIGILFAIWARVHLGRNWSPVPAIKEGHELVTSGPYRFVRHPIYTGILLAAFGTALTGMGIGLGACILGPIIFFLRIDKEERIMLELFPDTYPAYQARTKKLIPFVW